MNLGQRLRIMRKANKLSLEQLAKKTNLTTSTLCGYENGRRLPNSDSLILLCKCFQCSSDYILGLTDFKHIDLFKELEIKMQKLFMETQDKIQRGELTR